MDDRHHHEKETLAAFAPPRTTSTTARKLAIGSLALVVLSRVAMFVSPGTMGVLAIVGVVLGFALLVLAGMVLYKGRDYGAARSLAWVNVLATILTVGVMVTAATVELNPIVALKLLILLSLGMAIGNFLTLVLSIAVLWRSN